MKSITLISLILPILHIIVNTHFANTKALSRFRYDIGNILFLLQTPMYEIYLIWVSSFYLISLLALAISKSTDYAFAALTYSLVIIVTIVAKQIFPAPLITERLKKLDFDEHRMKPMSPHRKFKYVSMFDVIEIKISSAFTSMRRTPVLVAFGKAEKNEKICLLKTRELEIKNLLDTLTSTEYVSDRVIKSKIKVAAALIASLVLNYFVILVAKQSDQSLFPAFNGNAIIDAYGYITLIFRMGFDIKSARAFEDEYLIAIVTIQVLISVTSYFSLSNDILVSDSRRMIKPFLKFQRILLMDCQRLLIEFENDQIESSVIYWQEVFKNDSHMEMVFVMRNNGK